VHSEESRSSDRRSRGDAGALTEEAEGILASSGSTGIMVHSANMKGWTYFMYR
jgi:hypothetical protein